MLKIDDVQPSDSGTYKCTASNTAVDETGNKIVRSQSMKVDVICKFLLRFIRGLVPSITVWCSSSLLYSVYCTTICSHVNNRSNY